MEELKWTSLGLIKHRTEAASKKIDLTYLEKFGNCDVYNIPSCFEKYNYKKHDKFIMRISNIYDLTKFWVVHKYRELEAFQLHLFRFYYKHKTSYHIPRDKIQIGLYCIAFTDGGYYRGVISSCPPSYHHKIEKVKIFFYDYGLLQMVNIIHLYYLGEIQSQVPKFAIRASLAGVVPLNGGATWNKEDVQKFAKLVTNKELIALVDDVDEKRQLISIHVAKDSDNVSISDILIQDGVVRHFHDDSANENESPHSNLKVNNLYAFPTHLSLENGEYPFKLEVSEKISEFTTPAKLYPRYYHEEYTS